MGDQEPTGDIDGGQQDRGRTEPARRVPSASELQHPADDDDPADRVGDAHQRCVKRGRHIPDHLPADDAGKRKDGQVGEKRWRRDEAEREQCRGADESGDTRQDRALLRRLRRWRP